MEWLSIQNGVITKGGRPFLLRGFGLGGWFLPEGYMWKFYTKCDRPRRMEELIRTLCGEEYEEEFWEHYLDHFITEQDMIRIRENGFNSVRLPVNARHLYLIKDGKPEWISPMRARIDRLVKWCEKWELYLILDMHGAPGGQTGQNIDDCENDYPELFTNRNNQEELIWLWTELAYRYRDSPCIAGYDLLNEPIVNLFPELYPRLLPLYRELISHIRRVDHKHIIILEGAHWATDFGIFDDFTPNEASDGILLQFHKYWNNPDRESLSAYQQTAKRLGVPLFMGEGGENNCDWYSMMFPMLEREGISWSFWSYKKMECNNSPMTFRRPLGWDSILEYLDGGEIPGREEARSIWNDFLCCIREAEENPAVWNALNRKVPVTIPAEAFDDGKSRHLRSDAVVLRTSEAVDMVFAADREGRQEGRMPDYRRYGGEMQPESERILVRLRDGDRIEYDFCCDGRWSAVLNAEGSGELLVLWGHTKRKIKVDQRTEYRIMDGGKSTEEKEVITLICEEGCIFIDCIRLDSLDPER